jgi:hypothetical protein
MAAETSSPGGDGSQLAAAKVTDRRPRRIAIGAEAADHEIAVRHNPEDVAVFLDDDVADVTLAHGLRRLDGGGGGRSVIGFGVITSRIKLYAMVSLLLTAGPTTTALVDPPFMGQPSRGQDHTQDHGHGEPCQRECIPFTVSSNSRFVDQANVASISSFSRR